MKKVLILQNIGKSYGGVWQVNKIIGEELIKKGYEVLIVSIRNNKNNLNLEHDEKLNVFTINEIDSWGTYTISEIVNDLKKLKIKNVIQKSISKMGYQISLEKDIKKLKSYIFETNPDYIVTSHYQLLDMIPKKYLSKTINEQHSSYKDATSHKSTKKTLQRYKDKVKFLWLTKKTMESAIKDNLKNSTYIYNPVRIRCNEIANVTENKKLITIARLSKVKRIDLMVDIVEELFSDSKYKDWIFEIYGTGEEKEKISKLIKNHDQIKLMGLTDNPKTALLNSSINLNTSLYEGFSLSILEANECGVPTITFDFGESVTEEIIDEKTGIIAKSRKDYIEKLQKLMDNNSELKELSKNCKEFSKNFHIEKIIKDWIKLFAEIDINK